MAKQIAGLCFFEGAMHGLTFYKMDGQYYARAQSTLTRERVKTADEFRWTMVYSNLLSRASKIGSAIYKALPPGWRQFWMYRSFTGEAFTLLKENPYTDEQVKQILWKCYAEDWEQIKAVDPNNPIFLPKPKKIRKRRECSLEAMMRKRDKYGRPKYPELIKVEKERKAREIKEAWAKKWEEKKQAALAAEALAKEASVAGTSAPETLATETFAKDTSAQVPAPSTPSITSYEITKKSSGAPAIYSRWRIGADGNIYPVDHLSIYNEIEEACHSS